MVLQGWRGGHLLQPRRTPLNWTLLLVTLGGGSLEVFSLDAKARPHLVKRFSTSALDEHLAPTRPIAAAGLELGPLMAAVGTTRRLASLRAEELADRLYLDADAAPQLAAVIEAAKSAPLRSRL